MSQEVYKIVKDRGAGGRGIFWSFMMCGRHALCYRLGKTTKARFGGVLVFRTEDAARRLMVGSGSECVLLRGRGEEEIPLPRARGWTQSCRYDTYRRRWVWRNPHSIRLGCSGWPTGTLAFKTFTPEMALLA